LELLARGRANPLRDFKIGLCCIGGLALCGERIGLPQGLSRDGSKQSFLLLGRVDGTASERNRQEQAR
jgi:hypothetical protein